MTDDWAEDDSLSAADIRARLAGLERARVRGAAHVPFGELVGESLTAASSITVTVPTGSSAAATVRISTETPVAMAG